jgi:hypothetical protein
MSHLSKTIEEQQRIIKFLASKYQKDTGRKITLPSSIGDILGDPSIKGDNKLVDMEDELYDQDLRKGRIAAETLQKPLTFFEAVESLRLPRSEDVPEGKRGARDKKAVSLTILPHHMITKIDLSGFKNLRFSKAGLQELVHGVDRLPCIRSVSLKNNGICDDHDKEILALMSITKVKSLDLSCN